MNNMNSEWKLAKLGDYISIKSGLAYKGDRIGYGESILLGMGCVSFKDIFVDSGARLYDDENVDDRYCVKPGDIVLATRQQSENLPILAMPAVIPDYLKNKKVIFGTNLYKVDNNSEISNRFLFWLLKHQHYVSYIAGIKSGTAVQMVTKKNIESYKFLCPPKADREKIADILWSYEELSININKRISVLEQLIENIYKDWFVRFKFPGYEKEIFENGIPKGWEIKKLKDVAEITYGYSFDSSLFIDEKTEVPVVRIRDIPIGSTSIYTTETCDKKYLIHKNDILVGMDGIFHMCIWRENNTYLNQRNLKIKARNNMSQYYLYFSLYPQVKYWEQIISGTTVAHLGDKHINKMKVILPKESILSEFNSIADSIMEEINKLWEKSNIINRQKDLLLPRLMSGKIDLSKIEVI